MFRNFFISRHQSSQFLSNNSSSTKKKNRVRLLHGDSLSPPVFTASRSRGSVAGVAVGNNVIGTLQASIRVTGSRPVSFLPDSSSAFDKHRRREEYPLQFATFTRLFTNGLVTRRSAPPPHPTPCPTLSLPGAKRSPPSPPPTPRNSSWRK